MSKKYHSPSSVDVIRFLFSNWKVVLGIPFLVAVIVAVYSLFIPNKFKSTANLLPSQRPSFGLDLFSEDGGLSSIASSVLGGNTDETNRYIVLLSSYSTSKKIIDKFDLINVYEVNGADDEVGEAIKVLNERSTFENLEEGNFIISVLDEDPVRAKEITDYYVQLLNELNTKIVSKDARLYREFLEIRYNQLIGDLDSLQQEYIKFQKQYGVFELPEQVKEYFRLMGLLTAQQLEAEVKLQALSSTVSTSSDVYKTQKVQYEAITKKLNELYNDEDPENIILNFNSLAEVGSEYYDLFFQIEIQTEIQKFLLPLYEQAKMEEAKSLPIVSVIDEPRVALIKSEPRRSIIVIFTGISAFILVTGYMVSRFTYLQNKEFFDSLRS
ncbi:MAG: hypothetical protein CL662_03895 [Bacteroidetes bacterium]|jgi:tyrosine-protein kinase Etk/Wzc|nr:hypothetical protein [Bacteroidota bacterium]MAC05741.1 hypothetical protein [Balneola sp.]MAO77985.1 hypothetical protein [Balneola sp.]MBF65224.1 hypothetical protein [Balneola sp.]HBZ37533.1 hypothetical protein [Balneola sp.]|tara:strand:- start:8335 stop:9483 length:1149 start_codon:yes stop_codon:yes gene_type:complete